MTTISPGTDTVGAQSGVRVDAYRRFMQSFIDGDLESAVKFAADDAGSLSLARYPGAAFITASTASEICASTSAPSSRSPGWSLTI